MEGGYFVFFDACQGAAPVRVSDEWTDYLKGQCVVLIAGLPLAAVVFWAVGAL